jgi:hypothetical protein
MDSDETQAKVPDVGVVGVAAYVSFDHPESHENVPLLRALAYYV